MGFNEGFNYVKADWKKILYSYWALLPIIGWFAIMGYMLEVINSLRKKEKSLPKLMFSKHLGEGFVYFIHVMGFWIIVTVLNYVLTRIPLIGVTLAGIVSFIISVAFSFLMINYANEKKFANLLDYKKIIQILTKDPIGLIVLWIKTIITATIGAVIIAISSLALLIPVMPLSFTLSVIVSNYFVEFYNQ